MSSGEVIGNIAVIVVLALIVFVVISLVRRGADCPAVCRRTSLNRLGRFQAVMQGGFHLLVPVRGPCRCPHRPAASRWRTSRRSPLSPLIAMWSIDSVIYFQITDPRSATYEVANFPAGVGAAEPRRRCVT